MLNTTPRSERPHIAIFGRRNAGKSSLINALTNQQTAIVSDVLGTTTDPVYKSMEILPLGPVVIIDTAGLDDSGELGELRVKKTYEVLDKTDIAVLVVASADGITDEDLAIIKAIKGKGITPIIVFNKSDLAMPTTQDIDSVKFDLGCDTVIVSSINQSGIESLKMIFGKQKVTRAGDIHILDGLVKAGDVVLLVTPIDSAAPKGRLILPQQQVLRDILDLGAMGIVVKETELKDALKKLGEPDLVITDSQVFEMVDKIVPQHIPLTGFSVIFARHKGDLKTLAEGSKAIAKLKDGDTVLIAEGCTHHRQKDDIGTVKIPAWLKKATGKNLKFDYTSGQTFTEDVKKYALIVHCGACMLNRTAVLSRLDQATAFGVPIVNYGVTIAYVHGMMERAMKPFDKL